MGDFTLYPHQNKVVGFAEKEKYLINSSGIGLGKTLTALHLIKKNKLSATIIVPKYLLSTWECEIERYYPQIRKQITLVPYSQLKKNKDAFKGRDFICLDESTFIKSIEAQRSEYILDYIVAHRPEYLMLLTGTPILNRITEFYTQLYLVSLKKGADINNSFLGYNYYQFCNTFSNAIETTFGTKYVGLKNMEIFKAKIKDKIIQFKTSDILDLPEKVISHIDGRGILSEEIQDELWNVLQNNDHFSTAKAQSALLKTPLSIAKGLEILENGENVITFTEHVASANAIADAFKVLPITGKTNIPTRDKVLAEFKNSRNPKALVLTSGTSAMGLNLQGNCSQMIFNDLPYIPAMIAQMMGRIYRNGQKSTCFFYMINGGAMDKMINKTLESKLKDINQLEKIIGKI